MREEKVKASIEKSVELGERTKDLAIFLSNLKSESGDSYDLEATIPGKDSSLADIFSRVHAVVGIVTKFDSSSRANTIPFNLIEAFERGAADLISSFESLRAKFESLDNNGGFNGFDHGNFHAKAKNGSNHDFRPLFQDAFDKSETFLQRFFSVQNILKPRGAGSFQAAASSLSSVISEASERLKTLNIQIESVQKAGQKVAEIETDAGSQAEELSRLKGEAASDRKSVADYLADVTQQRASVQSVHEQAAALESEVKSYRENFEEFKNQLEERKKRINEGNLKLSYLISNFNNQKETVDSLIEKADQMLSSATVTGLAKNFADIMDDLKTELKSAKRSFYFGIFVLMLSSIPLVTFVALPMISLIFPDIPNEKLSTIMHFGPGEVQNSWQYLGHVVARISILIPAAWLVSFAAIRHSSLFRLREHYAYKYSMAVSVEGFKKQAPEYEEEIAALVLEQLAFNPADKLLPSKHIREGKAPGLAGYLIEKIRQRIDHSGSDS